MSDTFIERRRNPARKKQVDLAYQVVWNQARQSYDVHRAGAPTGGTATNRDAAIGLAIRGAQAEPKGTRVAVYTHLDGKQRAEWTSWS